MLLICFPEDFFCLPGQYGVRYLQLLSFGSATDTPEILIVTSLSGYLTSQLHEMRREEVFSAPDYDANNINV